MILIALQTLYHFLKIVILLWPEILSRGSYKEIHRRNSISDSLIELWRIDPFNHNCHAANIITTERYSMAISLLSKFHLVYRLFQPTCFRSFFLFFLFRDLVTVNLLRVFHEFGKPVESNYIVLSSANRIERRIQMKLVWSVSSKR